jgi:peptidoglycan/LPS O-acetylase OafA/YrhL
MHVVALLALLGALLPLGRLAMQLAQGKEVKSTTLVSLLAMAVLCAWLLWSCVRSFVQARRRRAGSAG